MPNMRISFELTNRCNLNCQHCMRRRDFPVYDLDYSFLDNILCQAKEYGIDLVALTGGEPFLHPDWQKMFTRVAEKEFKFSLVTNGLLLSDAAPFLAQPSIRKHVRHVSVSLDGATAEVNDSIRGKGSYRKAMQGILAARARDIPLLLKFTVTRRNFSQIEDIAMMASHLEMQRVEFAQMHPTPENIEAGLMLTPKEWMDAETKIRQLFGAMKMDISMCAGHYDPNSFSLCAHLSMNELYVEARGYLAVCCMLPGIRGMDPDKPERDLVADLHDVSLAEAHHRLVDIIAQFHHYRISRILSGEIRQIEHFQCMACALYFEKLDWLRGYPDNPWARLIETKGGKWNED